MTTLQMRLPHQSTATGGALTRIASYVVAIVDVFGEAQDMARAAHRRYPFIEW